MIVLLVADGRVENSGKKVCVQSSEHVVLGQGRRVVGQLGRFFLRAYRYGGCLVGRIEEAVLLELDDDGWD